MYVRILLTLALFVGCKPQPPERTWTKPPPSAGTGTGTGAGTGTTTGTGTGTGSTVTTGYDCLAPDDSTKPWTWVEIEMEEDFDIDADGFAIVQAAGAVVGQDLYGNQKLISSTVSSDASGLQVLSTGEIAVGAQDEGSIKIVDPLTGGWEVLFGGMTQPNGLEVGADDRLYVSEMTTNGRVRWYDIATDTQGVILDNTWMPNGVVLSPDEQVLYVGGHTSGGASSAILAIDRISDTEWDSANVRVLFESGGGDFDGVEVDVCGYVYTVEYTSGRVIRIAPDGSTVVELADLEDPSAFGIEFNALRWGNGVNGWDPETLYVTDRNYLYPVEIGVPGKPSPSSVWTP